VLNGRALDPATLDGNRLPAPDLQAENELRVEADMRYSRTGEGMHRFTDPVDGQTYLVAQCGVDNAHRVFAAFDQPDLKAALEVTATAPLPALDGARQRPRAAHRRPARARVREAPGPHA
jgi:aminopeptidase N